MSWTCTNDHTNADGAKFCKSCGEDGPATKPVKLTTGNGLPMWESPKPYTKPDDSTVCGEWLPDGHLCQKTIREHIEEFRTLSQKPNTLLSRPSMREVAKWELPDEEALEQRRQMLLEQAEQMRTPR